MGLQAISLFTGVGGLDLAARRAGIQTVCYVEKDRYAQAVLMSRIRDGQLDDAPIWDDVCTLDASLFYGIDGVFGGFPCQPSSVAGKGEGTLDDRWLWPQFGRIIRQARPRWLLAENVPGLLSVNAGRAFGEILRELDGLGYYVKWRLFSAAEAGAPHLRDRVWILGNRRERGPQGPVPNAERADIRIVGEWLRQQQSKPRTPVLGVDGEERLVADSSRRKDDGREQGDLAQTAGEGRRIDAASLSGGENVADAASHGRFEGEAEPERKQRGPHAPVSSQSLADSNGDGCEVGLQREGLLEAGKGGEEKSSSGRSEMGDTVSSGRRRKSRGGAGQEPPNGHERVPERDGGHWSVEPNVGRVAHGVAFRVDRLRCIGNGVVPQQAIPFFEEIVKADLALRNK